MLLFPAKSALPTHPEPPLLGCGRRRRLLNACVRCKASALAERLRCALVLAAGRRTHGTSTPGEGETLIEAARGKPHGHRDATMILLTYRHGLRAAEVCDYQYGL
jgi:hypothetical protein